MKKEVFNAAEVVDRMKTAILIMNMACLLKAEEEMERNNVCNAIDRAWTWFHTGFVNNFISKDPETNSLHLN